MAAAFGSGVIFSLVSGVGGPNQVGNAVTSGLLFSLVQGGIFQVSTNKMHLFDSFVNQNNCVVVNINATLGMENGRPPLEF